MPIRPAFSSVLMAMVLGACARQPLGADRHADAGADGASDRAASCADDHGSAATCDGGGESADAGSPADDGPVAVPTGGIVGVCTVGRDVTCNEDPAAPEVRGKCLWDGSCSCSGPNGRVSSESGKCLAPDDPYNGEGCEYAGKMYIQSDTFPCSDGCSTCQCGFNGEVTATSFACPDGMKSMCGLDDSYSYVRWDGGPGDARYQVTIAPSLASPHTSATYTIARNEGALWGSRCAPALPSCGDPSLIDLADIMADILDPVVQSALWEGAGATTSSFGIDAQNGTGFGLSSRAGRSLHVGAPCNGAAGCREIPAAIAKLVTDLRALDEQELASPSCAVLAPSYFSCNRKACRTNLEYCARAEFDGFEKVARCLPYPTGCNACDCASKDAASVLQGEAGCPPSTYHCSDGSNTPVTGPVPTLRVECTI